MKCFRGERLGRWPPCIVLIGVELPTIIWPCFCVGLVPCRFNSSAQNRPAQEYRLSRVGQFLRGLSRWQCRGRSTHWSKISATTWVFQETRRSSRLGSRRTTPRSCRCGCHRHIPTSILIPSNRRSSVLASIGRCRLEHSWVGCLRLRGWKTRPLRWARRRHIHLGVRCKLVDVDWAAHTASTLPVLILAHDTLRASGAKAARTYGPEDGG